LRNLFFLSPEQRTRSAWLHTCLTMRTLPSTVQVPKLRHSCSITFHLRQVWHREFFSFSLQFYSLVCSYTCLIKLMLLNSTLFILSCSGAAVCGIVLSSPGTFSFTYRKWSVKLCNILQLGINMYEPRSLTLTSLSSDLRLGLV